MAGKGSSYALATLNTNLLIVLYDWQLSRIESLLGVTGVKRVIGMLGQDERKRIYLEDLTSRIYVDLTNAVLLSILLHEPSAFCY